MIRVQQVKVPLKHTTEDIKKKCAKLLRLTKEDILEMQIVKQSIDARKKNEISYVYAVDVKIKQKEEKILSKIKGNQIMVSPEQIYRFPESGNEELRKRPVIIGLGPAGLFCAYALALHGYQPVVFERGKNVAERTKDVLHFWETGVLDTHSNVQFGEGGAGAFSDGKLNTLVKDVKGRNRKVLEIFVNAGAPSEILYESKPHIGTDVLVDVVANLRKEILRLGGEVHFESEITDFTIENGKITAIEINQTETLETDVLVLAIGHSARDTFEKIKERNLTMEAKSFAVGFRVEHPQEMVNKSQYKDADMRYLPAAPYKLTAAASNGRGVYSFCMCPGGFVVNASSEEKRLAVNGMSYYKRDSANANSAIIISVTPEDFPEEGVLAGAAFQRALEEKAYALGNGKIPQQLYGDYVENRASQSYGDFKSCVKGRTEFSNLRGLLKPEMEAAFLEGMENFSHKITGFNRKDAILSGIESRTSSPVRISRNEAFESNISGIYPCGEGAGYAGGIMSAAMDGMKVAEAIGAKYHPVYS